MWLVINRPQLSISFSVNLHTLPQEEVTQSLSSMWIVYWPNHRHKNGKIWFWRFLRQNPQSLLKWMVSTDPHNLDLLHEFIVLIWSQEVWSTRGSNFSHGGFFLFIEEIFSQLRRRYTIHDRNWFKFQSSLHFWTYRLSMIEDLILEKFQIFQIFLEITLVK